MSADNSFQARIQRLRERTLATFHRRNPTIPEAGRAILDESTRVSRRVGQIAITIQPPEGPAYTVEPCCAESCSAAPNLVNFTVGGFFIPSPPYESYSLGWPVSWTPVPGVSVALSVSDTGGPVSYTSIITGSGTATVYSTLNEGSPTITLTLTNDCGTASASAPAGVCFLAGARVAMADRTEKPIEEVAVGDRVIGAFGEINTVLALHRPLTGANKMCCINGDHHSSNHHPHVAAERGVFYSNDIAWLQATTYQREHDVINAAGETERRMLYGLAPARVVPMAIGSRLKTIGDDTSSRPVETLDVYTLPPETQLYNLVVSGSHTYHVDGYAVTGWPREDDFDYDTWTVRTSN